ncbi:hypothetical protein TNCV_4018851 [Trichonephila clavipes]|nr:hypothetical protein TNCV_4018851 [Trichonephila clavipes]
MGGTEGDIVGENGESGIITKVSCDNGNGKSLSQQDTDETKLPVRLFNTTNEWKLVQGHETTPLRVKGDIEDVYSELGNGGTSRMKHPELYCSRPGDKINASMTLSQHKNFEGNKNFVNKFYESPNDMCLRWKEATFESAIF